MLERSQRPLGDEDRRILERYRQNSIGAVRFDAKHTFLGGASGLILGFLWLGIFHWGDRSAPSWPVLVLVVVGAAIGFAFDRSRAAKQRMEREAAAAAKWNPIMAVGVVERVVAEASQAVRVDDNEANTAWFLQVGDKQVLCVWDWADDASESVEVDVVPGSSPTALKISWTGKKLTPLRPKRKFKRGEREPEQCDVLSGTLEELDDLLRKESRAERPKGARQRATPNRSSKLADDVESLGFYKYVTADQKDEVKGEIEKGASEWYLAAGRAFDADAERLAEGGVKDLLDYMRPALKIDGWDLGEVQESYDIERGYTIRIGADLHVMWGAGDEKKSWELTTTRTAALVNEWLREVGSQERVHLLYGGEDGIFVLLSPIMQQVISKSGVFQDRDVPGLLEEEPAAG